MGNPEEAAKDMNRFWRDQDLIRELRSDGSPLSIRAADAIAWLRDEMIDPAEYMRVSNERGRYMTGFDKVCAALDKLSASK